MITIKTVSFTHIATACFTKSLPHSCYKRIQRFFRFLKFDPFAVASMLITLFDLKDKKLRLAFDRINWKLGRVDINTLMLTVAYKEIVLPLM
ncbi:MAG: hypothetical protein P0S93_05530 [Candidatus Neptunochlamydia sp.]|nr:hypothetical protein [Candidatus Neptunochlamydia sp.]